MVLLSADCASCVSASASSRNIILKSAPPIGDVFAKFLILFLTTSMPRSSDALSSVKFSRHPSLKSSLAIETAVAVFPTPGGPEKSRCGRFLAFMYDLRRSIVSVCPTTSPSSKGLYFSIQISSFIVNPPLIMEKIHILLRYY